MTRNPQKFDAIVRTVKFSEEGGFKSEILRRSIECSRGSDKREPVNTNKSNLEKIFGEVFVTR